VHQTRVGTPAVHSHLQRVDDELGTHVVSHRPANDRAGVGVLDSGQVQPALPRAQIGDVSEPQHVRGVRPELALDKIISDANPGHSDRRAPTLARHKA